MRKSIIFISTILTSFVLAMLAGVVWAYKGLAIPNSQPVTQQNIQAVDPTTVSPVSAPPASQTIIISPQDAASLAANFLNRKDLYSIEIIALNGSNVYKMTFGSGDILYVSLSGQVLSYVQAPTALPQVTVAQSSGSGRNSGGGGGGGETEHEGGGD